MRITAEFLYTVAPGANGGIVDAIVKFADRVKITDPIELAYFIGQCACETGGFTRIEENLYYTSVQRLRQVWPTRFKSDSAAAPYVRNPSALANKVYGGRFGNRPGTTDGYDYRGSGIKQTTFRANFAEVETVTGVQCVSQPDLLRMFPHAVDAASVYWTKRDLGRYARAGSVEALTKAVQGGSGGLADRRLYTERALKFVQQAKIAPIPRQKTAKANWLRKGSTGDAVKALQRDLLAAGYYDGGRVDGNFGDGTDNAVRDFQRENGLIVDGVVGEKTVKELARKIGKPVTPPTSEKPASGQKNGLAAIFAALIKLIVGMFQKRGE